MVKLEISSNSKSFFIDNLDLEIKLNLIDNEKDYLHIGDHIYYYFTRVGMKNQPSNKLIVSEDEYKLLEYLNDKKIHEII